MEHRVRQVAERRVGADSADRDVIAADQHAARLPRGPGLFGGQAKMKAVARVVCDDEQGALVRRDGLDGRQDLLVLGEAKTSPATEAASMLVPT